MCRDEYPHDLLKLISVAQLTSGKTKCTVRDGVPHYHAIEVENFRHETLIVRGRVRGSAGVMFEKNGNKAMTWDPDVLALGGRTSNDRALILVGGLPEGNSVIRAELGCSFDDEFKSEVIRPDRTLDITIRK